MRAARRKLCWQTIVKGFENESSADFGAADISTQNGGLAEPHRS